MENKGISVVICCYNSAKRLPETLAHLAAQNVSKDLFWEVIVVNNNSKDETKEVALAESQKHFALAQRTIIIDELAAGLSHARNSGIEKAKYDYIIFCDDDNWLDTAYVQTAFEILDANPKIGACGGQSEAVSDIEFPEWFEDYKGGYAVGKQAPATGDITNRKYLWGSGLAFRKKLYQTAFAKLPSLLTDRKGSELSSGGDSEICMRFCLLGYKLYYDERLKFKHYISPERLTWSYRKRLFNGFSEAGKILVTYGQWIDINQDSFKKKIQNLVLSTLRITNNYYFKKNKAYSEKDADYIFLLTGFSFLQTSKIAKVIKKIK